MAGKSGRCCNHETAAQLAASAILATIAVFCASTLLDLLPLLAAVVVAKWLVTAAFKKHECPQTLRGA